MTKVWGIKKDILYQLSIRGDNGISKWIFLQPLLTFPKVLMIPLYSKSCPVRCPRVSVSSKHHPKSKNILKHQFEQISCQKRNKNQNKQTLNSQTSMAVWLENGEKKFRPTWCRDNNFRAINPLLLSTSHVHLMIYSFFHHFPTKSRDKQVHYQQVFELYDV